ncbi:hypothetical protein SAMN04490243_0135 [Robiginitalea myxolifaciens]|uniref:CAAX prenyl protease 2/Lysostaphin resistance protein A-like domain-containing protein n=1 Tax=Robiginitalea myxolifaciens TaxID=400055 RepID=A0A1I6FN51_9FLAO|nr:type II CAAX endopeptidase family protein [Robiginitalea myxolifaciens]SFR31308.1 hypothetical protein SAMN04490243_0135 [Robiginitalea myxolifaciens]
MKKPLVVILITLLTFALYYILDEMYFGELRFWLLELTGQLGLSHNLTYLLSGLPLYIAIQFLFPKYSLLRNFGLDQSVLRALVFALICTLPMFLGFGFTMAFNEDLGVDKFLITVVAAGFFEELFFRGFLFGNLYRGTRLGFIPSVFLGALLFGLVHLYQSSEISELIGIFLVTFLGGFLFAWVYVEWGFNLWVAIFLHAFMNLAWDLFDVSSNALGDVYPNIFRLITIALVIGGTIGYKRFRGIPLAINRSNLFLKPAAK